jgi:long-chain acyl-CoA synthetase
LTSTTIGAESVPETTFEVLERAVRRHGDSTALIARDDTLTYRELRERVLKTAAALHLSGVRCGDRVLAALPNGIPVAVSFFATLHFGGIWMGTNPRQTPAEFATVIGRAHPDIVIVDETTESLLRESEVPKHIRVLVWRPGNDFDSLVYSTAVTDAPAPVVAPHAEAAVGWTSGSTGIPKGVVHTQHNMLLPTTVLASSVGGVRLGVCLPMTTLNVMILGPLLAAQAGTTCVLVDRRDATGIAEWIDRERIERMTVAPATIYDFTASDDIAGTALSSWRLPQCGGSGCPQSLVDEFESKFGNRLIRSYGLSEAPTIVAVEDRDVRRVAGSSGRVLPHLHIQIRDSAHCPVPVGAEGEIWVGPARTGPWANLYTTMVRYEGTTIAPVEGGYLRTGDVGRLDEDGNLHICGRTSQIINRGGVNIYPDEIEGALRTDRMVIDCAVTGAVDARLGERVVAYVVLRDGADLNSARRTLGIALSRYKIPEQWLVVDDLPRNAMGKVMISELPSPTGPRHQQ